MLTQLLLPVDKKKLVGVSQYPQTCVWLFISSIFLVASGGSRTWFQWIGSHCFLLTCENKPSVVQTPWKAAVPSQTACYQTTQPSRLLHLNTKAPLLLFETKLGRQHCLTNKSTANGVPCPSCLSSFRCLNTVQFGLFKGTSQINKKKKSVDAFTQSPDKHRFPSKASVRRCGSHMQVTCLSQCPTPLFFVDLH